jgi:hypothetical protein
MVIGASELVLLFISHRQVIVFYATLIGSNVFSYHVGKMSKKQVLRENMVLRIEDYPFGFESCS